MRRLYQKEVRMIVDQMIVGKKANPRIDWDEETGRFFFLGKTVVVKQTKTYDRGQFCFDLTKSLPRCDRLCLFSAKHGEAFFFDYEKLKALFLRWNTIPDFETKVFAREDGDETVGYCCALEPEIIATISKKVKYDPSKPDKEWTTINPSGYVDEEDCLLHLLNDPGICLPNFYAIDTPKIYDERDFAYDKYA